MQTIRTLNLGRCDDQNIRQVLQELKDSLSTFKLSLCEETLEGHQAVRIFLRDTERRLVLYEKFPGESWEDFTLEVQRWLDYRKAKKILTHLRPRLLRVGWKTEFGDDDATRPTRQITITKGDAHFETLEYLDLQLFTRQLTVAEKQRDIMARFNDVLKVGWNLQFSDQDLYGFTVIDRKALTLVAQYAYHDFRPFYDDLNAELKRWRQSQDLRKERRNKQATT